METNNNKNKKGKQTNNRNQWKRKKQISNEMNEQIISDINALKKTRKKEIKRKR